MDLVKRFTRSFNDTFFEHNNYARESAYGTMASVIPEEEEEVKEGEKKAENGEGKKEGLLKRLTRSFNDTFFEHNNYERESAYGTMASGISEVGEDEEKKENEREKVLLKRLTFLESSNNYAKSTTYEDMASEIPEEKENEEEKEEKEEGTNEEKEEEKEEGDIVDDVVQDRHEEDSVKEDIAPKAEAEEVDQIKSNEFISMVLTLHGLDNVNNFLDEQGQSTIEELKKLLAALHSTNDRNLEAAGNYTVMKYFLGTSEMPRREDARSGSYDSSLDDVDTRPPWITSWDSRQLPISHTYPVSTESSLDDVDTRPPWINSWDSRQLPISHTLLVSTEPGNQKIEARPEPGCNPVELVPDQNQQDNPHVNIIHPPVNHENHQEQEVPVPDVQVNPPAQEQLGAIAAAAGTPATYELRDHSVINQGVINHYHYYCYHRENQNGPNGPPN